MRKATVVFCAVYLFLGFIFEPKKEEVIIIEEVEEIEEVVFAESHLQKMPLTLPNLKIALDFYGIKHQEVVVAQAILETGWFKSQNCKERNNLFGLYDSRKKEMFRFGHWSLSVRGYRDMIQYRMRPSETKFRFLKRIGYAEDPQYIEKLKRVISKNNLEDLK